MVLQKPKQFEHRREVFEFDQRDAHGDPLFEREWEVFVVKRDPETGKFVTETVAVEELAEIS